METRTLSISDRVLFFSVIFLLALGVVMVYSASSIWARQSFHDGLFFLKRHLVFTVIGFMVMLAMARLDYRLHYRFARWYLLGSVFALTLLMIPGIGKRVGGATRWLSIAGFTFQPSEVAKISLILFLAYSLSKKQEKIQTFSVGYLPHILVGGVFIALLAKQPDFGTLFLASAMLMAMMFIAGVRLLHLATGVVALIPFLLFMILKTPYRLERVVTFMNPWRDPHGSGFQIIQSMAAIHSGGLTGLGLGSGRGKLFYLPAAHTDFIMTVIAEEFGFIGVAAVLAAFCLIVYRAMTIARLAPDLFGRYLASGIGTLIGIQAATNIGVVFGMIPTKGLTLPLLSYGGTALICNLAAIGILLNIGSRIQLPNRRLAPSRVPSKS